MSIPGATAPDTSAPALLLADYACGPGYRIGPYGRCYPYRRPSYFAPPRRYDYDRPRYYYDRPRYYRDDDDD